MAKLEMAVPVEPARACPNAGSAGPIGLVVPCALCS